jgi:hypothetical protein
VDPIPLEPIAEDPAEAVLLDRAELLAAALELDDERLVADRSELERLRPPPPPPPPEDMAIFELPPDEVGRAFD